jgi:hypothetical protein
LFGFHWLKIKTSFYVIMTTKQILVKICLKITTVGGSCIKKEIIGLYLEVIFVRDNIYIYI